MSPHDRVRSALQDRNIFEVPQSNVGSKSVWENCEEVCVGNASSQLDQEKRDPIGCPSAVLSGVESLEEQAALA